MRLQFYPKSTLLKQVSKPVFSFIVLITIFLLSAGNSLAQTATITTDYPDYAPGSTATFTGAGFVAGDSVSLVVHHADGTPDSGADHNPWIVYVDANGGFVTTWHVCEDDCLGSTLKVTADGIPSGLHAEALFTDATLITTEEFSYSNALTANGWSVLGTASTPVIAIGTGLTYTGSPSSGIGNAASMGPNGDDNGKLFAAVSTAGGSTVYASSLVNVTAAQATGDYFIGLMTGSAGSPAFALRVYIKSTTGGFLFGCAKGTNAPTYETTVRSFGTYLLAGKYIYNAGTADDIVSVWVNPILGIAEGTATITNGSGFTDAAAITGVFLRQGTAANASTQRVDGIRVGTAWADVTPYSTALINYVYHERTNNNIGCGNNFIDVLSPNSSQTEVVRWKVEYQNLSTNTAIYYTTDGTTPSGSRGVGSGTTQVLAGSYFCTFGSPVVDGVSATLPAQAAGTVVKYIIGAWHSAGGNEIFANSGNCSGCGAKTSSASATSFTYTVTAAPVTITASAGANGSISPNGTATLASGSNQTYTITANAGYYIAGVLVDGVSVGAVSTYTFSNVTTNRTISASFVPLINYVYHEATTNNPGCGTDNFRSVLTPNNIQSLTAAWKIEYQFQSTNTTLYYTTDGTTPSGSKGVAGGTSIALAGTYSCTFNFNGNIDIAKATIPAQPAGTIVRYIIGAWHTGGGNEIFANSGATNSPITSSANATLFTYTVAAAITEVDFANLQFPATATITTGNSVTAFAQVYEPGVTDASTTIAGAGITAWIGVNATNNTDPSTWPESNWTLASFNAASAPNNNDEYQLGIGATLNPGTYYYASRFQLTGGPYKYGGYFENNTPVKGGFWGGQNVSGVLTVNCTTPAAPTITAGGPTTFCTGGSVVLTSSAATGNTWSNGATTQSITVSTGGSYTVTFTNGFGCTATSLPKTVTVNTIPATPTISAGGPTTFCSPGSVTLTSSSASGNLWSNGETTQSIVVSTSGTYSVVVTTNGCPSAVSNTITVTANSFSSTATVFNENFGTSSSLPSGWSVTGSSTWANSTGVSSSGDYTNASGGSNVLADNNSSQDASLVSPTINFSGSTNGVLTFGMRRSSTSFTRSIAVEASTDNGANFTAFSSTIAAGSINSGSYSLQTINLGSSINNATQVKLRFRFVGVAGTGGPTLRIDDVILSGSVAGAVNVSQVNNCGGTASLTASSGSSYLWTPGNATTQSLTINSTGNYSVTVTSANGCSATNTGSYSVIPALAVSVSSTTNLTCNGVPTGIITVAASNGTAPYSYTIAGTTVNTTGATSGSFTGLAAGTTYVVTAKDAKNCTIATSNITITQPSAIVATAVVTAPLCNGGNGTVVVSASGGTGTLTGTGSNTVTAGQTYSFTVMDASGCSSNTISGTMANPVAVPPTVHTKDITVDLLANGTASITAAQIDNGSSDACGPITLAVSPSTFNCGNIRPVMSDLIISEYVEGSSNIKYLEIYNGTAAPVNLANYELRNYANGSTTPTTTSTVLPAGTLASGSTIVYKNIDATGYNGTATVLTVMTYNGNDVVALFNNVTGQFADIIGQIGLNPGTEWGTGNTSTADNTIRRKSYISSGDVNGANAFVPATEWDGFATDDVSGLGSHTYTGGNLVTLTVTNTANNLSSTGTAVVTVRDVTAPVAPTLSPVTGECSASVTAPTAEDNCKGTVTGTTTDPTSYNTQGTYTITWKFNDGNGNESTATQTVVVDDVTAPVAPTLSTVTGECSASVTTPKATDNCVGDVTGTTTDPTSYNTQGTYTITWKFNDGNGNESIATQTVVVDDVTAPVAPTLSTVTGECSATVTAPTAQDNCKGTVTGTTTDPTSYTAQGNYTITWKFNDGNGNESTAAQTVVVDDITAPVAPTLSTVTGECSATVTAPTAQDNCKGTVTGTTTDPTSYNTQGTYTITWKFNDGNGNESTAAQTVVVDDVTVPTWSSIENTLNRLVYCGQNTLLASAQALTPTATDNCPSALTITKTAGAFVPSGTGGAGSYTNTFIATDVAGNSSIIYTQVITVIGITIDASATSTPIAFGNSAILKATVTPSAEGIPVVFTVDNGNGVVKTYSGVTNTSGLATATAPAADLPVEVYLITATAGSSCASSIAYLPVYDPNGGFVTGGGWINSPAGAYAADLGLTGKANFGFVAKYKKGSSTVDGNTEFQFHSGSFNFKSTGNVPGTLVISGSKATYKGDGTVNGSGNYGFLVAAVDGQITGGGGYDRFRIKIWDKTTNAVVYDNQKGSPDNADATTIIAGGSIVIHEVKKAGAKLNQNIMVDQIRDSPITFKVRVFGNPAVSSFRMVLESGIVNESVTVKVVDVNGRLIEVKQNLNANQVFELGNQYKQGIYFAEVIQGTQRKVVKLIKIAQD